MKAKYSVALAMAASFALGGLAVQGLHAQAKPPAYVVAEVTVKDQDGYTKEFLPAIGKAIQAEGGKFIARGGKTASFTESPPSPRVVLVQYESLDKAQAWWNSTATKDAYATGEKYASFRLFAVEGASP
jgi:uncharacterized protein (DUF1330 family)